MEEEKNNQKEKITETSKGGAITASSPVATSSETKQLLRKAFANPFQYPTTANTSATNNAETAVANNEENPIENVNKMFTNAFGSFRLPKIDINAPHLTTIATKEEDGSENKNKLGGFFHTPGFVTTKKDESSNATAPKADDVVSPMETIPADKTSSPNVPSAAKEEDGSIHNKLLEKNPVLGFFQTNKEGEKKDVFGGGLLSLLPKTHEDKSPNPSTTNVTSKFSTFGFKGSMIRGSSNNTSGSNAAGSASESLAITPSPNKEEKETAIDTPTVQESTEKLSKKEENTQTAQPAPEPESTSLTTEQLELIAAPDSTQSKLISNFQQHQQKNNPFDNIKMFHEKTREKMMEGFKTLQQDTQSYLDQLVIGNHVAQRESELDESMILKKGTIHKLRSGLGGKLAQSWEKRKLILLKSGHLLYFSLEEEDEEARGTLFILKEQTSFFVKPIFGSTCSSPTPFVLSINLHEVNIIENIEWKVCFTTHEELILWLNLLVDIVVQCSIEKDESSVDWKLSKRISQEENLQQVEEKQEKEEEEEEEEEEVIQEITLPPPPNSQHSLFSIKNIMIFSNIVLYLTCFCSSMFIFWILVIFYNAVLSLSFFIPEPPPPPPTVTQRVSKKKSSKTTKSTTVTKAKANKTLPIKFGSTAIKYDPEAENVDKIPWQAITSSLVQVRSHDYLSSKVKVPSCEALYELCDVDFFEVPKRLPNFVSSYIDVPSVSSESHPWASPEIFIIQVSFPTDPPSLSGTFGSSSSTVDDGNGVVILAYLRMKESTKKILQKIYATNDTATESYEPQSSDPNKSVINAVKLFEQWCKKSPTQPSFQARFKMIPYGTNLSEIGLPSYLTKYNNKPLLIKRAGTTGIMTPIKPNLLCFEINFYPFPYLAKQGISHVKANYLSKLDGYFTFVIEGRDKSELPEVLIGSVSTPKDNLEHIVKIQDYLDTH